MMAKLAGLLVTFFFLASMGHASTQQGHISGSTCFLGWIPVVGPKLCTLVFKPNAAPSGSGLKYGYYNDPSKPSSFCPNAEGIVKATIKNAVSQNPGIGAGLIRLFFHDCFVRGCDGSVLLNTTASGNNDTEREGLPNVNSLRGFEVIDAAKAAVEAACPNKVSCADIVAFAAADASYFLSNGAVNIWMPGGRYDGRESFADDTNQLPGPFSILTELLDAFQAQGLDLYDVVTLSGAHTIGHGRCFFVRDDVQPGLAAELSAECSGGDPFVTTVMLDNVTPNALDNQYYKNVKNNTALFMSDAALNSSETIAQVNKYATFPGLWASDFAKAMVKMGNIGVKNSTDGEIRKTCWKVNSY